MNAAKTAAQRKADERARHKAAGRVAVTVYIYPAARAHLTAYIKRLNERWKREPKNQLSGVKSTG